MDNWNYMFKGLVKYYFVFFVDGLKIGIFIKVGNVFIGIVKFSNGNWIIMVVMYVGVVNDSGMECFI